MAENFYTLMTDIGLAKIANAQVTQEKIDFVQIAIGDGNGSYYNPSSSQTSLVKEVWRGAIGLVGIDETNNNWIIIESAIPAINGGFFVREVGLFDSEGDLIAIGKYPETYKPKADEGSTKDLNIRMIIEVSNAASVTLKIDPTVIMASRKYVDDRVALAITPVNQSIQQLQTKVTTHEADKANPHAVTKAQVGLPNVDNVKQMPHAGGTFNGIAKALPNSSYAVPQLRNVSFSMVDPVNSIGDDGDIWIKYT